MVKKHNERKPEYQSWDYSREYIVKILSEFVGIRNINSLSDCCGDEVKRYWKKTNSNYSKQYCSKCEKKCSRVTIKIGFDPFVDWNDWRTVEIKILEDEEMAKDLIYGVSSKSYVIMTLKEKCEEVFRHIRMFPSSS